MILLKATGACGFRPLEGGARHLLVEGDSSAPRELSAATGPFVIGRAKDCHLVLPQDERLKTLTSRWHCHLVARGDGWLAVDGSLKPVEDYGGPKPSATGTFVNGSRIQAPAPVHDGDTLEVGPWKFHLTLPRTDSVELISGFQDPSRRTARTVEATDPRLMEKFGQLHQLVQRLAQIPSFEESLTRLISTACEGIPSAEVAAILESSPAGRFKTRLAWQKGSGPVANFRFSESLLRSLPPKESFLLEARLATRSASQALDQISSGLLLPLWGKGDRLGVLYLDNRHSGRSFTEEDLFLATALASIISLQLALERQARLTRIEENMARYFSPDVVQGIVAKSDEGDSTGIDIRERTVSVLFVDLEGFSSMCRARNPREVADFLNPYLEAMAGRIQAGGGHVNKFIGDAVLGIFGAQPVEAAPLNPSRYAVQAIQTALDLPAVWEAEASRRGLPSARIRIGVDTGKAVVGNIGYKGRIEYGVLGDPVNAAARIEKLAPPNRAAVSEYTRILAENRFDFEDLGDKEVKGFGRMRLFSPVRSSRG